MKNSFLRIIALIVAIITAAALFVGCNSGEESGKVVFTMKPTQEPTAAPPELPSGVKSVKTGPNPDDSGRYNITVEADEGTVLVFETNRGPESRTEHTVSNKGCIIFSVGSGDLLPFEPIEQNPCPVTPKIYVKAADGGLIPIEIPPISIEAPEIAILFDTPDSFTAANGRAEIRGMLTDPQQFGAELSVNGQAFYASGDGSFVYSKAIDTSGEQELEFTAKLSGCLIYRRTFTVNASEQLRPEDVIVIPNTLENYTRLSNADEFIRISGTVPSGTTLAVVSDDPGFDYVFEDNSDGRFTIRINTPTPEKVYPFTIIGVTSDGTEYRRAFSVERPPKYSEYVQKCWAENYAEMKKESHVSTKQPFRFKCTIAEIIYNGDYVLARATLSTAPDTVIEVEYHNHYATAAEFEIGEEYVLSGYSLGMVSYTENGGPEEYLRMYIWFVDDRH